MSCEWDLWLVNRVLLPPTRDDMTIKLENEELEQVDEFFMPLCEKCNYTRWEV